MSETVEIAFWAALVILVPSAIAAGLILFLRRKHQARVPEVRFKSYSAIQVFFILAIVMLLGPFTFGTVGFLLGLLVWPLGGYVIGLNLPSWISSIILVVFWVIRWVAPLVVAYYVCQSAWPKRIMKVNESYAVSSARKQLS